METNKKTLASNQTIKQRNGWNLILKPHPANPVKVSDHPNLDLTFTDSPLEQLLLNFQ